MVSTQQGERYTSLHLRLEDVYHLKEQNGKDMIALSEKIKYLHNRLSGDWKDFTATAKNDNIVNKASYRRREEETAAFLETWGDFMKRFMSFFDSNADVHKQVVVALHEIMNQNKRLSQSKLSAAKVDATLDSLEKTTAQLETDMQQSVATLQTYQQEIKNIQERYQKLMAGFAEPDTSFEVFFGLEKENMPDDVRKEYEENYDALHFFSDVFEPWHRRQKIT